MIIKPVSENQILSIEDDKPVLSIVDRHGSWLKKRKRSQESTDVSDGQGVGLAQIYQSPHVQATAQVFGSRKEQEIITEVSNTQHTPVTSFDAGVTAMRSAGVERDYDKAMKVRKANLDAVRTHASAGVFKRNQEETSVTEAGHLLDAAQVKHVVIERSANALASNSQMMSPLVRSSTDITLGMTNKKNDTDTTLPTISPAKTVNIFSDSSLSPLLDSNVMLKKNTDELPEIDAFIHEDEGVAAGKVLSTQYESLLSQSVVQAKNVHERSVFSEIIPNKKNPLVTDKMPIEGAMDIRDSSQAELTWHFKSWSDNTKHTAKLIFPDLLSLKTNVNIVPSDELVRHALIKQQNSDEIAGIQIDIALSRDQGREQENESRQHYEEEESET